MSPPLIRSAEPSDIPAITRIYAAAVLHGTASFEIEPPSETEMTRRYRAILDKRLPYLVATRDDAVIGYAYCGPYHARAGYRFTLEDSIYIAPEAHRAGAGRALLTRLLADAEAQGYRQMIAVIGGAGNVGSIALHRALGFEAAGVLRNTGFKFGGWLDTVFMQRALGDGASTPPG